MSNLIDALLHAARLEGGDITPHKNTVELTSLVTDLGDELRSMGKKKKIATKVFVPKQKIEMETDSVLLHVIFKNLFSNAVKYTPEGGDVSVSMEATKTAVYIEVSDNGIGIPKVAQKRLFQRLFRASNVLKMDTDGNGLGLYITNMVVDSLGGKISVESTEGKGSTFIVTLPIKKTKAVKPKKKKK
jgi:signal transduction histidine kinase